MLKLKFKLKFVPALNQFIDIEVEFDLSDS